MYLHLSLTLYSEPKDEHDEEQEVQIESDTTGNPKLADNTNL